MSGAIGLHYARYGNGEWMMHIAPAVRADKPPVLLIPPLFEEMNRLRALMAGVMRALAAAGHACALPDLPGTGESERPLDTCGWDDWREAVEAAAASLTPTPIIAAFRGGCLLDEVDGIGHWWLTPVAGAMLIRDMDRAERAGGAPDAGYPIRAPLRAAVAAAEPVAVSPLRTMRLASDPGPADAKLEGAALWRRSEPGDDAALAQAIAQDIASLAATCAAS